MPTCLLVDFLVFMNVSPKKGLNASTFKNYSCSVWRVGSTYIRNSVQCRKVLGRRWNFWRQAIQINRTWSVESICGNLNYLCCIVYCEHELLHVCVNSAVPKSFPIKIEFVDHGIRSGLIMSVRKKKSEQLTQFNEIWYSNHYILSSRPALSSMVAAHVVTEHLKCVPSVTEKLTCKFYLIFLKIK